MEIHRKKLNDNITVFYFTRNKNQCLRVEYKKNYDFGEHSTSGTDLEITIHYQNSWVKDELEEITISDVPKCITDTLNYLNPLKPN